MPSEGQLERKQGAGRRKWKGGFQNKKAIGNVVKNAVFKRTKSRVNLSSRAGEMLQRSSETFFYGFVQTILERKEATTMKPAADVALIQTRDVLDALQRLPNTKVLAEQAEAAAAQASDSMVN